MGRLVSTSWIPHATTCNQEGEGDVLIENGEVEQRENWQEYLWSTTSPLLLLGNDLRITFVGLIFCVFIRNILGDPPSVRVYWRYFEGWMTQRKKKNIECDLWSLTPYAPVSCTIIIQLTDDEGNSSIVILRWWWCWSNIWWREWRRRYCCCFLSRKSSFNTPESQMILLRPNNFPKTFNNFLRLIENGDWGWRKRRNFFL